MIDFLKLIFNWDQFLRNRVLVKSILKFKKIGITSLKLDLTWFDFQTNLVQAQLNQEKWQFVLIRSELNGVMMRA